MNNIQFSDEDLRQIAEQKVNARKTVKIHVAIFFLVNLMLFIINIIFSPTFLWVLLPFLGWFIGLAIHIVAYILYARGIFPAVKRAVIIIFTAYLCVTLLLFTINYIFSRTINWAFFPVSFIGAGIIILLIIYSIFFRSSLTENGEIISKKEKAIKKELRKMAKKSSKDSV
jgi:sensor histidine kinase YesM